MRQKYQADFEFVCSTCISLGSLEIMCGRGYRESEVPPRKGELICVVGITIVIPGDSRSPLEVGCPKRVEGSRKREEALGAFRKEEIVGEGDK